MKGFFFNIKYVWKYAKDEKKKIILYSILSLFNLFITIGYPLITAKIIIDLTNSRIKQLILMGLVLLTAQVIFLTANYFRNILYHKIVKKINLNIQADLGKEILKLSNKTLEENGSGVFIQRLIGDTNTISSIFTDFNKYATGIIGNIGILITYFILSKVMFVFVLFNFAIRLIIEILRINHYYKNVKLLRELNDRMTGFSGEIVRGAEDIKMLNGEDSFLNELKNRFEKLNTKAYNTESKNVAYLTIRSYWGELSFFLMILILAISISSGNMSVAVAVVIFNLGNKYNNFVYNITGCHELIKKFNLAASRIFEIYNNDKYEKESFGTKHLDSVNGDFEFKNVSFKYTKNEVLKDLSFKVKANETVAFVGKSGAGKTTIFNLLCKMYDNYSGLITIDNVDIKELDKDSIRGNITIVSQNPYIFNMSIKDNLRLVKENLTNKEMKKACKMACLDDFIESLPDKYDTIVGEGGITLSGGQKQRLAIARAFVQKTEIILFDEATSALDNETQAKIQKAIDNLQKEYTILIIAHRLSTIKNADRILFLNEGKIIAKGKHEKLLKECREYKELYETEISKIDSK